MLENSNTSGVIYSSHLADAGSDYHEHQFHELPGLTFYMPADQGYHGATNSSGQTKFKTKSHY